MSSRQLTIIEVGFIALVGLVVLTWFRGDTLLMTSASVWPLNWHMFLQETLSVWDASFGLGSITARQVALMPLALLGATAEALGMSASLFQKIMVYSWFAGSGLAMWWLCSLFRFGRLARMVAALFYMASPYAVIIIWSQSDGLFMPFFAAAPFGLALFLYTVFGHRSWGAMVVANILLLLTMITATLSNPAFVVIFWLPCMVAALGWIILYPRQWYSIGRYALRFIFIWVALNSFWLVPLVVGARDEYIAANHQTVVPAEDQSKVFRNDLETLGLGSVRAVDALRLTGLWSVTASYGPDPYYVWAQLMTRWPAFLLSFLIPALLILGMWGVRQRRSVVFLGAIFGLAFLLVVGIYPPVAEWRVAFLTQFPALLRAFRAIFSKFGILLALSMAPLVGLGVAWIYNTIRSFSPRGAFLIVCLLVTALLGIGGWPVWTGDVIQPGGYLLQSGRVRIPEFYHSLKRWSENQPGNFRVLSLPLSKTGSTAYHWDKSGYIGGDFIRWFFPGHPVLFGPTDKPVLLALPEAIKQASFFSSLGMQRLFGLLNIQFVLLHRDFYWPANANAMMFNDEPSINRFIQRGFLKEEQRWGDLVLMRSTGPILPKFYAVLEPIFVVGSGEHIFDSLSLDTLPWPTALFVLDAHQARDKQFTFPGPIRHAVITTSVDQEMLERARRELSSAQADQSPLLTQREIAVRILHRSFDDEHAAPLYAPWAGKYVVTVAKSWLIGQRGLLGVTITDAAGQQHDLSYKGSDVAGEQHYQPMGVVNLSQGPFQIRVNVDGEALGSVPPGTFLLYTPFVETEAPVPWVDFKQFSSTSYSANVRGASKPFLLVFSEAYHRSWRAGIRYDDGSVHWLPDNSHVPINGYANGWWIDGMSDGELVITFKSQRYFWFGLTIAGVSLGVGLIVIGWRAVSLLRKYYQWYTERHAA